MRVKPIALVLGALVLALLALVATRLERYSEEVDRGFDVEARQNPYLAAQMLAQQRGLQVSSHTSLTTLDQLDRFDTLFISRSSQIISPARLAALLDWLEAGGRLIVAASYAYPWHSDLLLEHFQLNNAATHYHGQPLFTAEGEPIDYSDDPSDDYHQQQTQRELEQRLADLSGAGRAEPPESLADAVRTQQALIPAHERLEVDWDGARLVVHFDPDIALQHPYFDLNHSAAEDEGPVPGWYIAGTQGVHLAGFDWGRGEVIVLSDSGPFTSTEIDLFDHAELWQHLAGQRGRLGIIYGAEVPSLWNMMLRYLPEALLAFALWLPLWLWRRARRFGPVLRSRETVRRSRLEHIGARADYLWRGRWQAALVESAREDLLRRARQVVPEFNHLDSDAQFGALARLAGIDSEAVARALTAPAPTHESAFVAIVQLLQRIRNAL